MTATRYPNNCIGSIRYRRLRLKTKHTYSKAITNNNNNKNKFLLLSSRFPLINHSHFVKFIPPRFLANDSNHAKTSSDLRRWMTLSKTILTDEYRTSEFHLDNRSDSSSWASHVNYYLIIIIHSTRFDAQHSAIMWNGVVSSAVFSIHGA